LTHTTRDCWRDSQRYQFPGDDPKATRQGLQADCALSTRRVPGFLRREQFTGGSGAKHALQTIAETKIPRRADLLLAEISGRTIS